MPNDLRKPKEPRPKYWITAPFHWIEWCLEWISYSLGKLALFKVLEYCARLTILLAVILYIYEAPARRRISENNAVLAVRAAGDDIYRGSVKEFPPLYFKADSWANVAFRGLRSSILIGSALHNLERIDRTGEKYLRKIGLWSTAGIFKAFGYYRVNNYVAARNSVNDALKSKIQKLHPSDEALMNALAHLITIDQVQHLISFRGIKENEEMSKDGFKANIKTPSVNAIAGLDEARKFIAPRDREQIYLIQAQLAAYRNLKIGYRKFAPEGRDSVPAELRNDAQNRFQDLSDVLLVALGSGRDRSNILLYWHKLTDLNAPENRCMKKEICE
jgi:hypothetical protein